MREKGSENPDNANVFLHKSCALEKNEWHIWCGVSESQIDFISLFIQQMLLSTVIITRIKDESKEKSPWLTGAFCILSETNTSRDKMCCIKWNSNGFMGEHRRGTLNLPFKKCINWASFLKYAGGCNLDS